MAVPSYRRDWQGCLVAGCVTAAGYPLLPNDGWWHAGAYGICALASVAAVLVGVRRHRPPQAVTWWALVAGLLFWLVSAVIAEFTTASPWNDIGQFLGLAGYPCIGWALINLLRGRARTDSSAFIDAGIVATSLGLLYWIFIIGGAVTDGSVAWPDVMPVIRCPIRIEPGRSWPRFSASFGL